MLEIIGKIAAIGFFVYQGYQVLRFLCAIIAEGIEKEQKIREYVSKYPVLVAPPPPPPLYHPPHVHAHFTHLPH